MAPIFSMKITDFRKDTAQVKINTHYIRGFFSSDMKRSTVNFESLKSLKYFDDEAEFDKTQSNINDSNLEMLFIDYDPYKLFTSYCDRIGNFPSEYFDTSRSCLSKIMNTPFEVNGEKRKWTIKAKLKRRGIHLYYDKIDNDNKSLGEQYELLKRHFFVKMPMNYYRKVNSVFSEIFAENRQLNLGDHNIIFTTEIPGIISNNEIKGNDQLKTAEHVYCDIFKIGEFSKDVINYNPIWWSKAVLINAKQCIIGAYNHDENILEDLIKFNIDKFEDKTKYENLWTPNAAWNFLNEFLQFVKDAVNSVSNDVRSKCIWQFESFHNDKPYVNCEIFIYSQENGQETMKPLSYESVNFH